MWKFLRIAPEYKIEFKDKIRISNISSMEILAYMAIFFLFVLMYLDYLRYQDGYMNSSYVIFLLFLNHLAFAYHFIPLVLLRLYRKQKIKLDHTSIDRLINISFTVISITLLVTAIFYFYLCFYTFYHF